MTIKSIAGIDHAVVVVKDLDAAAENWKRLGFTISPRGTHSAHMGTGNYTIMLGEDYIELLGVLNATEHNAPSRAFLDRNGGGIERIAFTTPDASAGAAEIRTRGYAAIGPTDFERPVTMPDGRLSAAKFATFQWPVNEAPGVRLFACQHKTRETVWIPELQKQANTAKRIAEVLVATPEPEADARHLAKMIDGEIGQWADGAFAVPTGFGRADFVFLTRETMARRYPGVPVTDLPERAGAGLRLVVDDLAAAKRAAGAKAVSGNNAVIVPPAAANGVMLAFVQS